MARRSVGGRRVLQAIVQAVRAGEEPADTMFLATLICSDEACAEEVEVVVSHALEVLDGSACACGCTHVLLAVSGWERAEVRVLAAA